MQASFGMNRDTAGKYHLHTSGCGSPHCFASELGANALLIVFSGSEQWSLSLDDFLALASDAICQSSFVTVAVAYAAGASDSQLFALKAGSVFEPAFGTQA